MSAEHKKFTMILPQTSLERLNQAVAEQIVVREESAGSWSLENHPDMPDDKGIDTWLKTSRQDWH